MWVPNAVDSRIMQISGMAVLVIALGSRWVPPLRRLGPVLAGVAALLYIGLGLGIVLYHLAF